MYCSTSLRHVAEISISVVSVSLLMESSSLQVLKIVKSGYVLSPISVNDCKREGEGMAKRGQDGDRRNQNEAEKGQGKKKEKLTPRSGISKPVESDPSSQATCKKSIPSISPEMVDSSFLDLATRVQEYGILRRELVYLI